MTMRWFGPAPFSAVCADVPHVPTPVGTLCLHCEESIDARDRGYYDAGARPMHYECFVRMLVGSVAHQTQRCSCFGGAEEDPPGLSKRDAARLALLAAEGRL